jgi:hypothetical protein
MLKEIKHLIKSIRNNSKRMVTLSSSLHPADQISMIIIMKYFFGYVYRKMWGLKCMSKKSHIDDDEEA